MRSDGEGPPLVLVHGWGANGSIWQPVIDRLRTRYRLMAPDLPGHGLSAAPPGADWDVVPALAGSVDAPADWVGWSLGGLLALRLAWLQPERVRSLTLVSTGPRFTAAQDWPHAVGAELLARFEAGLGEDPRSTLQRFLALQTHGGEGAGATLRDLRLWMRAQPVPDPQGLAWGLRQLARLDLREALAGLALPCRVILGSADALAPAPLAGAIRGLSDRLQVRTIAGAAHVPFRSHGREFLQLLTEFIH